MRTVTLRTAVGTIAGAVVTALAVAGCGAAAPAGAPSPPKGLTLVAPAAAASAEAPSAPGRDDSPTAAAAIVTAYFARINGALTSGTVANLADLALPGCNSCATDLGVIRDASTKGLHANGDTQVVSGVTAQPRIANGITVRFTVVVRPLQLINSAGAVVTAYQGQSARTGTAILALTRNGWRIQTFVYGPRPT